MGAAFGPAVVGELLRHVMERNAAQTGSAFTHVDAASAMHAGALYGMRQQQALVVSMKEIYGLLLIVALIAIVVIGLSYAPVRPFAIFHKWHTIRRGLRRLMRHRAAELAAE